MKVKDVMTVDPTAIWITTGAARGETSELEQKIKRHMWKPHYVRLHRG